MDVSIYLGSRKTFQFITYRDGGSLVLRDNTHQVYCFLNNRISSKHRGKLFKNRIDDLLIPVTKEELLEFTQLINEALSTLDTVNEYTNAKKEAILQQLKALNADYDTYYSNT